MTTKNQWTSYPTPPRACCGIDCVQNNVDMCIASFVYIVLICRDTISVNNKVELKYDNHYLFFNKYIESSRSYFQRVGHDR